MTKCICNKNHHFMVWSILLPLHQDELDRRCLDEPIETCEPETDVTKETIKEPHAARV